MATQLERWDFKSEISQVHLPELPECLFSQPEYDVYQELLVLPLALPTGSTGSAGVLIGHLKMSRSKDSKFIGWKE